MFHRLARPLIGGALLVLLVARSPEAAVTNGAAPRAGAGAGPATEPPGSGPWRLLPAPASRMVRLPAVVATVGSSPEAILEATAECARAPFGHSCRSETPFGNEYPPRRVAVAAFFIDRTEVTVRDWQRCVARGHCPSLPYSEGAARFAAPNYPVTFVTWEEARLFCAERGARLPTELEWERAARGSRGRRYPWGETFHRRVANHGRLGWDAADARDGHRELAPVGSFPGGRTPEGVLDLAGNAAEWVEDRLLPYPGASPAPPGAPPAGRVVRGGDWSTPAPWLRGAARREAEPGARRPTLGFRCARSAEP